jgi:CheY-like chemotaxis protein
MAKRVLDVGNCGMDHANISALLRRHFAVEIERAHGVEDALEVLRNRRVDLVTVNRLMESDGSPGLQLIEAIKANPQFRGVAVMMISDYQDCQEQAVEAGAVPGFGKSALHEPATVELLKVHLEQH